MSVTREQLERLSKDLADHGKLIEAGFVGMRLTAIPLDAPEVQVDEMRKAFMAGAQHLFASIMTILDPGEEPTDADLRRIGLIDDELREYADKLMADLPTSGRA